MEGGRGARAELGLPEHGVVTLDQIRKAYRKRSLATHPDKGGTAVGFRRVKEARDLLVRLTTGAGAAAGRRQPAAAAAPSSPRRRREFIVYKTIVKAPRSGEAIAGPALKRGRGAGGRARSDHPDKRARASAGADGGVPRA